MLLSLTKVREFKPLLSYVKKINMIGYLLSAVFWQKPWIGHLTARWQHTGYEKLDRNTDQWSIKANNVFIFMYVCEFIHYLIIFFVQAKIIIKTECYTKLLHLLSYRYVFNWLNDLYIVKIVLYEDTRTTKPNV